MLDEKLVDSGLNLLVARPTKVDFDDAVAFVLDDPLEQPLLSPALRRPVRPARLRPAELRSLLVAVATERDQRVGLPVPVARDLAELILVVQEPDGRAAEAEAELFQPVDECTCLVRPARSRTADPEKRVGDDHVYRVLVADRLQRL